MNIKGVSTRMSRSSKQVARIHIEKPISLYESVAGLHSTTCRRSQPERIGVRHSAQSFGIQRRDRLSAVEPDVFVELPGQLCHEVMALALGFRAVDHAYRAFWPAVVQTLVQRIGSRVSQWQPECRHPAFMAQPLPAAGERRPNLLDLHRIAPVCS